MILWKIELQVQEAVRRAVRLRARAALLGMASGTLAVVGLFGIVLGSAWTEDTMLRAASGVLLALAAATAAWARRTRQTAKHQEGEIEELISDFTIELRDREPARSASASVLASKHRVHPIDYRVHCHWGE